MSDAKRQAHAAAEFDEAAALRRAGGQAGEDLEVNEDTDDTDDACSLHLVAYAERKALAEALLAQPAAGKERERDG